MTSIRTHLRLAPLFQQVGDYVFVIFEWAGGDASYNLIHRRNALLAYSLRRLTEFQVPRGPPIRLHVSQAEDYALLEFACDTTMGDMRLGRVTAKEATLILQDCAQCGVNI